MHSEGRSAGIINEVGLLVLHNTASLVLSRVSRQSHWNFVNGRLLAQLFAYLVFFIKKTSFIRFKKRSTPMSRVPTPAKCLHSSFAAFGGGTAGGGMVCSRGATSSLLDIRAGSGWR